MKIMGPKSARITGKVVLTGTEQANFWKRVEVGKPNACWMWKGAGYGRYGSFMFRTRVSLAHRVAFFANGGEVPDGWCVCHSCDNTKCVNPAHLFAATQKVNMVDMVEKGRCRSGRWGNTKHPLQEAA